MTGRQDNRWAGPAACIIACLALIGPLKTAMSEPARDETPGPVRVEGVVRYDGPLPEPIPIPEAGTVRQLIEVEPKTSGLKDAMVWLEGAPAPARARARAGKPIEPAPVRMDQRDYRFAPHVLAIDAGQEVEFLNNDAANHGVTADSSEEQNRFNVVTPSGGSYRHRFVASKRPVAIGCPIHGSMSAWIYVFDHPFRAVTDESGSFRLPAVPPGRYTLIVRHPDGGMDRRQTLVVRPGAPMRLHVDFSKRDIKSRIAH